MYAVEISVADISGSVITQGFSLLVSERNQAPQAVNQSFTTAEDNPVDIVLAATDGDNDALTYTVTTQPDYGQLTGSDNQWTYTPSLNFNGSDRFTFTAHDGELSSDTATVSLTVQAVNDAPVFQFSPALTAQENVAYRTQILATDSEGDVLTYSLGSPSPSGMAINGETGVVYWVPDFNQAGNHSVTVQVNDGNGSSITNSFIVTVQNINQPPVVANSSVAVNEDASIAITLFATDADSGDALTYTVTTEPVNGTLSGTVPNVIYTPVGDFAGSDTLVFEVFEVFDGQGGSAQGVVSITVNPINDSPVFTGDPPNTATIGIMYGYTPTVVDKDISDSLTFSLINPPSGLSLVDIATGELQWLPDQVQLGIHSFTLIATDTQGLSDELLFNVLVSQLNSPPSVVSHPFSAAVVDNTYRYTVNANDPDGDAISYQLVGSIPDGLQIDANGQLTWVPNQTHVGVHAISVSVADGTYTVPHDFDINVVEAPSDTPTHEGRDFWLMDDSYTELGFNLIFISATKDTTGIINLHHTMAPYKTAEIPFSVSAGEVAAIDVYYSQNQHRNDVVYARSIHVSTDQDVTVYAMPSKAHDADVNVAIPTSALGTDHYVMAYEKALNLGPGSELHVIATEDNTTIYIDPTGPLYMTSNYYIEYDGETIVRTLNKGDTYSLTRFKYDATGSRVRSDKPIAVFGKGKNTYIPRTEPAADRVIEQMLPVNMWGTNYFSVPLASRFGDIFRVLASEDNTDILINNTVVTNIDAGEFYEYELNEPAQVTGSKPILLAQYSTSTHYDQTQGFTEPLYELFRLQAYYNESLSDDVDDPEKFKTSHAVTIDPAPAINYVIVAVPPQAIGQIELDGELLSEGIFLTDDAFYSDYYMAQVALPPGEHSFTSTEPFFVYENINALYYFGDPFMVMLPSAQQFLDEYLVETPPVHFGRHFVNIVIETDVIESLALNGNSIDTGHFSEIGGSGYSSARFAINQGTFHLKADKPFGLMVYGFGQSISYGITGGMAFPSNADVNAIGLSAVSTQYRLGDEACVDVQASGASGEPLAAIPLTLEISGANARTERLFSNNLGVASYCYRGIELGDDEILISAGGYSASIALNWSYDETVVVAPVITSTPIVYILSGQLYEYQVVVSDANNDIVGYSLKNSPITAGIDEATGLVSWQAVSGRYLIEIEVIDASGLTATQSFWLEVNTPPQLLSAPTSEWWILSGREDSNFGGSLDIVDPEGDRIYTEAISLSDDRLDAYTGYREQASGYRGDHLTPGVYDFYVRVTDSHGESVDVSWSINVYTNYEPELVDTQLEHTIKAGKQFTWDFDSTDLNGDANDFIIGASTMRFNGVRQNSVSNSPVINSDGVFSWLPTDDQIGEWQISVRVLDTFGEDDFVWLNLTVEENPQQYHVPPQLVSVGGSYGHQLDTRPLNPANASFVLSNAPEGMQIDSLGFVSWIPSLSDVGTYPVTVTATDEEGNLAVYTLRVVVSDGQTPSIISDPIISARTEDGYNYQLEAVDPQNDALTWSMGANNPPAITVDANGLITWPATLDDVGEHTITVNVEDSDGNTGTQQYTLTVTAPGSTLWNRRQCQ